MKLMDVTNVIRSKNAGPYELTFDLVFREEKTFREVCRKNCINRALICELYQLKPEQVLNIVEFEEANAIKVTILRPRCSGDLGETDVYGAQQHAPFLDLELDL